MSAREYAATCGCDNCRAILEADTEDLEVDREKLLAAIECLSHCTADEVDAVKGVIDALLEARDSGETVQVAISWGADDEADEPTSEPN